MSQQKSKKGGPHWLQCDKCKVNLVAKDVDKHSTDCPQTGQPTGYNFVKDGILYGTLDLKTNEEIKGVSNKNNLVFLSQDTIQICSLSIGEWVLLFFSDSVLPPVAKIVWPTIEKSLTSVLLTKHGR